VNGRAMLYNVICSFLVWLGGGNDVGGGPNVVKNFQSSLLRIV
jgi:hypothetical protein